MTAEPTARTSLVPEAPVLGRDQRGAHLLRDLVVGEPLAEARAHRDEHLAVRRPNPNHLAEVVALGQLRVTGKVSGRDRDRDDEREHREQRNIGNALEDTAEG
jgi:hypothetical protein